MERLPGGRLHPWSPGPQADTLSLVSRPNSSQLHGVEVQEVPDAAPVTTSPVLSSGNSSGRRGAGGEPLGKQSGRAHSAEVRLGSEWPELSGRGHCLFGGG